MKSTHIVIGGILLILLIVAGFYYTPKKPTDFLSTTKPLPIDFGIWSSDKHAPVEFPSTFNETNSKEFTHPTLKFSFRYPGDMTVANFTDEEEGSNIILVQNAGKGQGFQVTISPFDEAESVLTEERVKQDIPDLQIKDVQPMLLGDKGQGIAFVSDNEQFGGKSREVWFILGGELYQVSTFSHMDSLIKSVLNSWTFK